MEISMLFNTLNTVKKVGFNEQCYEVWSTVCTISS